MPILKNEMQPRQGEPERLEVDAVVVGAGFSGLYAVYRLRKEGLNVVGIEAADGVGGTWFWNRYPGCRCDVPTVEYSYSFDEQLEQEWSFPESMSAQPEIETYLNHVADRFDLRKEFRFTTRVTSATFDEDTNAWAVDTDFGDHYTARWCVMATGSLSAPNLPNIPGVESFAGTVVHTGLWPREGVDLQGKRVAIIGTGSSGMQSIPHLARDASHLTVYQRTANYSFPGHVFEMDEELETFVKQNYRELRRIQRESGAGISGMTMQTPDGKTRAIGAGALGGVVAPPNRGAAAGGGNGEAPKPPPAPDPAALLEMRKRMEEALVQGIRKRVENQELAEELIPKDVPLGCKRIVVEIDYFETFNRDNVTLVNVRKDPIVEITPTSVRTQNTETQVDVLVLATGFDALTGPLTRIDIRGRGGRLLREEWQDGPRTYLGLMAAGYPNMFMITGPGSPSVLSNMVVSIEQHVDWMTDAILHVRDKGAEFIEPTPDAQDNWIEHVQETAKGSPYMEPTCNAWYIGANIEGKTRTILPYTGGVGRYRQIADEIAKDNYRGFALAGAGSAAEPS